MTLPRTWYLNQGNLLVAPARGLRLAADRPALEVEQGLLALQAAAVAGQRAVGADHPVTGDDDRDRVAPVAGADDPRPLPRLDVGVEQRRVDPRGELAVALGLAVGDLEQRSPDRLLQGGAV